MKEMKEMKEITCLLFDWVGVLVRQNVPNQTSEESKKVRDYIQINWRKTTTEKDLADFVGCELDKIPDLVSNYVRETFIAFEPLWDFVAENRTKYTYAVINNGPSITVPYFEQAFHFSRYGRFFNSEEEAMWKPDPRIFEKVMATLHVKPEQCLYFDDSPHVYEIQAPTGIKAFCWESHEVGFSQLKEVLCR